MKNKTLIFLMIVMVCNALSYGTIIPLLYPYARQFGIGPTGLGMLFASFSLFQFLATPVIGRLSDVYGRRSMLLLSIFGTSVSMALFASAWSVPMLFFARIIDGITGGNISVAQAAIADSVHGKDRAKAFGMIGASFGVGFLIGPAIGGLLSAWHITAPFWFAALLALLATIFGYFFLEETLPEAQRAHHVIKGHWYSRKTLEGFFNFTDMVKALGKPVIGMLLIANFVVAVAFHTFILGSQATTNDVLHWTPFLIGIYFAGIGLIGIVMQSVGIGFLMGSFKGKERLIISSSVVAGLALIGLFFARDTVPYVIVTAVFMIANAPGAPLLNADLSEKTSAAEQGAILGINQSYVSLGQIVGPLIAGAITQFSIPSVYLASAALFFLTALVVKNVNTWSFARSSK